MRILILAAALCVVAPAFADRPTLLVGRVIDRGRVPIEGATVKVGSQTAITNDHGIYHVTLVVGGTYPLTVDYGGARTTRDVTIANGQTTAADAALDVDVGEVIQVQGHLVKPVGPKPMKDPGILPPYSDEAIQTDSWARAWLLLDIDETGAVSRVKMLKSPGHGLDKIAIETSLATKFEPARDDRDRPKRSLLVHKLEWPSFWWLIEGDLPATHLPRDQGQPPHNKMDHIPCIGSGPLHMDSFHPVYRDCTPPPDPRKFENQAWITRP